MQYVTGMDKIPIKNIWWLMLYASGLFKVASVPAGRFDIDENPDKIPNLVAEILARAVERRLRYSLSSNIRRTHRDLTRVRGRINHIRTERQYLLQQGRIACEFDEFTTNTPRNHLVKAALNELVVLISDNRDGRKLRQRCRACAVALEKSGVTDATVSQAHLIRMGRMHALSPRVNTNDREMLAAAGMVFELKIPTESAGSTHMPITDKDDHWLRNLFEKAIGGFYDVTLSSPEWKVYTNKGHEWKIKECSTNAKQYIPNMRTDIILERRNPKTDTQSRMIIDTKFTDIMRKSYRSEKYTFKSEYIYQMYSYLESEKHNNQKPIKISGMLLHPSCGIKVDECATINEQKIHFATVDLFEDAADIRDSLCKIAVKCGV